MRSYCEACDQMVNPYGHSCIDRTESHWHVTNRLMNDGLLRGKWPPRVRRPTDNELSKAEEQFAEFEAGR